MRTVAGLLLATVLFTGACGDGSSGGTDGEDKPGAKTEDTGTGY
ncbi:MAG TPA: hypothetical protein VI854_07960 [Acidimicrobiia bacterium]|nr:hypothetical protein [Acidimicrobiia bacterium]